ncbi:hypothetical protein ACSBR2_025116 [Camellia fascicularis]
MNVFCDGNHPVANKQTRKSALNTELRPFIYTVAKGNEIFNSLLSPKLALDQNPKNFIPKSLTHSPSQSQRLRVPNLRDDFEFVFTDDHRDFEFPITEISIAALHALGNIAGETRSESNRMLNVDGEENLRVLIYGTTSKSSKLTPSGLFLSVLQQDSEILTDAFTETTEIGMEARHNCCQAIHMALMSSPKLASDPNLAGIAAKLEEAVRRGPYLARKHSEAQPAVMTAERF